MVQFVSDRNDWWLKTLHVFMWGGRGGLGLALLGRCSAPYISPTPEPVSQPCSGCPSWHSRDNAPTPTAGASDQPLSGQMTRIPPGERAQETQRVFKAERGAGTFWPCHLSDFLLAERCWKPGLLVRFLVLYLLSFSPSNSLLKFLSNLKSNWLRVCGVEWVKLNALRSILCW